MARAGAILYDAIECTQPGAAVNGVRLLIAAGADAAALRFGNFDKTALHHMAAYGPDDPSLAGLLMAAGCDPADLGRGETTALDTIKRETAAPGAKHDNWVEGPRLPRTAALLEAVAADRDATLAPYRAEVAAL